MRLKQSRDLPAVLCTLETRSFPALGAWNLESLAAVDGAKFRLGSRVPWPALYLARLELTSTTVR